MSHNISDLVKIKENQRTNQTRICEIKINNKTIITPTYIMNIRKDWELDLVCDSNVLKYNNINVVLYRLWEAYNVRKLREARNRQRTLFGNYVDENYRFLKQNKLILIDPATEYFYFSRNKDNLRLIQGTPIFLKEFIQNCNRENHSKFWRSLITGKNRINRTALIDWYVKQQLQNGADIIIPPSPLIDGKDESLIEYSWNINKLTKSISEIVYKKPSSIYWLLNFPIFKSDEQIEKIIEKLYLDESDGDNHLSDIKITFIKIKNYDFNSNFIERDNLKKFLNEINKIQNLTEKSFFFLDSTDFLGLVTIVKGADGFSEPLDCNVREYYGSNSSNMKGRYYHPEIGTMIPFDNVKKILKNNQDHLPCHCESCNLVNSQNIDNIDWNKIRRLHLLYIRNEQIQEIKDAIKNNSIRGIFDKLFRSAFKNYLEFI